MALFVFSFTCMHPFLCAVNSQKDFCLFNYCGTGTGILMQSDPPVNTWKFISTHFTDSRADAPSLALSCFYQPVSFWWQPRSIASLLNFIYRALVKTNKVKSYHCLLWLYLSILAYGSKWIEQEIKKSKQTCGAPTVMMLYDCRQMMINEVILCTRDSCGAKDEGVVGCRESVNVAETLA